MHYDKTVGKRSSTEIRLVNYDGVRISINIFVLIYTIVLFCYNYFDQLQENCKSQRIWVNL